MEDVKRTSRRIEQTRLFIFLIRIIALAIIPVVPLFICGFVAAGMYASGSTKDPSSFNYKFCWGVVWALVTWAVFYVFVFLMAWGCSRLSLRAFLKPSGLDDLTIASMTSVNIIDVALKRKSKLIHDKAFGMQSILQTLSKRQLDCSNSGLHTELGQVFRDLNFQILKALRHQQLIYIAALAPLSGQPCWMPDWTADIDSTWLSPSVYLNDKETLDYGFQITQKKMGACWGLAPAPCMGSLRPSLRPRIPVVDHPFRGLYRNRWRGRTDRYLHAKPSGGPSYLQYSTSFKRTLQHLRNEPETLKELRHLISVVTKQTPNAVKKWLQFLKKTVSTSNRSGDNSADNEEKVDAFGICRDGINTENARIVVIYGLYMPFLVRFREARTADTSSLDDSTAVGTLLSPVLFAGSLGFENDESGRSRFTLSRKTVLRLE
ncbi:hypothetical protein V8F06_011130 [Rhypophila decipiens]